MKNSWRWTIAVLGLIVIAGAGDTGAQRGGFGRGRGGGESERMQEMRTKMEAIRACPVDMMWAALSFEIEMTEDQRVHVASAMKDAWVRRQDVLGLSEEHDAWGEGRKRMRDLKKQTDARVKAVLEKDQWKAYEKALKKLLKAIRTEMPRRY